MGKYDFVKPRACARSVDQLVGVSLPPKRVTGYHRRSSPHR
jgi:hypothetical protein